MWSVSWYVICHKSAPSNTRFFPSVFAAGNSTSEPILFSSQHAPFLFLWSIFYYIMLNQLVNLTSVFVMLFVKCFFAICNLFKSITHALYKQKPPCKVGWVVYMGKNFPPKWDPGFMKVGSLSAGRIYFHIIRFWFFNRILL